MKTDTETHIDLGSDGGRHLGDILSVLRNESLVYSETLLVRVGAARVVKVSDGTHAAVEPLPGTLEGQEFVERQTQ